MYLYKTLQGEPEKVVLAMAIGNGGFLITALATARLTAYLGMERILGVTSVLYAIAPLALLLGAVGYPFAAVILWRLLYGTSLPPYNANTATIRQMSTPERLQGRSVAAINTVGSGALGLGPLVGGLLSASNGLVPTICFGAAVCFLGAPPAFLSRLRLLHNLSDSLIRAYVPS